MSLSTLRADERGFTMVTLMGVLLVVVSLVFVTYSAADGDLVPGKHDEERKVAYAAAEAGVQNYLFHLTQNDDYWAKCTTVTEPHAVNQKFAGAIPTDAKRLKVPGSPASYVIELLPAPGESACVPGRSHSMIEDATGTFRIRATGFSQDANPVRRSIVATFKRKSFLEYIYFTDYETQAPAIYKLSASRGGRLGLETRENPRTPSSLPQRDLVQWATETCAATHWGEGRDSIPGFRGLGANSAGINDSGWKDFGPVNCGEINFFGGTSPSNPGSDPTSPPDNDVIRGPLHTNDSILVCQNPRFGRGPLDKIEVAGDPGWRPNTGCSNNMPNVNFEGGTDGKVGTWKKNSARLELPPDNKELRDDALPAFRFVGRTKIKLDDDHMFISGTRENGEVLDNAHIKLPTDGALYVSNQSACGRYDPVITYPAPTPADTTHFGTGCGNVELEGTYGVSLTIGAENDVIVTENVLKKGGFGAPTPTPDVLLGLIGSNFVRVYHPVTSACANDGGPAQDMQIDAAILSVGQSFIHDYYYCGATTGKLTVNGAIAQKYRGPVGTLNTATGAAVTGYKKDYVYDDRLKYRSPPHFIDPVNAGWQIQLYTEQSPAK